MKDNTEYGLPGERSANPAFVMPAPTLFPLCVAFGLMLAFAGVIFHPYLSYAGLGITLASAIGWWRCVIPGESHEYVPVDLSHRPSGVTINSTAVARLQVGADKHRMQVPPEVHSYSSGVMGGLIGGVVMAALACVYGLIAHHSIWFPVNLLAGVVIPSVGAESIQQLSSFDGVAMAAAIIGHAGLSILVGVLYAVTLPMFPKYAPFWAGILVPLLWTGLVATLLNVINPALNSRISWPWYVTCQLAFGLVCGYVVARSERIRTMQDWGFAERADLDAPRLDSEERGS